MRKNLLIILMLMVSVCYAQPPEPPSPPSGGEGGNQGRHESSSLWRSTPIGTSTILMLSLGAGALALGIKRNNRNNPKE